MADSWAILESSRNVSAGEPPGKASSARKGAASRARRRIEGRRGMAQGPGTIPDVGGASPVDPAVVVVGTPSRYEFRRRRGTAESNRGAGRGRREGNGRRALPKSRRRLYDGAARRGRSARDGGREEDEGRARARGA